MHLYRPYTALKSLCNIMKNRNPVSPGEQNQVNESRSKQQRSKAALEKCGVGRTGRLLQLCLTLCCGSLATLMVACLSASAYYIDYLPLTNAELTLRFNQRVLADPLMPGQVVTANRCMVRMTTEAKLHITGTDRNSRAWSVIANCHEGYASVWTTDLDKNGQNDLIFLASTGANGCGPTTHLTVVMFDADGRPVPWQCYGYFEVDKRGLKDILDLDSDGRADILQQSFENGFWITSLYEFCDGRVRLRRHHGTRSFPIHSKFTYKPNRLPARHSCGMPKEIDWSNEVTRADCVYLNRVQWPPILRCKESPSLLLSNGRKCTLSTWKALAVVLDEPAGRRVALMPCEEGHSLLEEIRVRQIPAAVAMRNGRVNSFVLMWACQKPLSGLAFKPHAVRTSQQDAYVTDDLP